MQARRAEMDYICISFSLVDVMQTVVVVAAGGAARRASAMNRTGVMGQSMCGHLLDAGYSLTVYNRTPSKAAGLCNRGAVMAESPEDVARRSDVVLAMLGMPTDVRQVILGDHGVLQGLHAGGIVVNMTTSEPSLACEIHKAAAERGCSALDAPVSGDRGAKAASLSIMVGGDKNVFEAMMPLFNLMGKATWMGNAGTGQSCKFGNQVMIATTMVGMVEGMLYAYRAGLDMPTFLKAISSGAAASKSLELYSSRILEQDLDPGFFVQHFVKDLGIALRECQTLNLCLPGLALAQQLYVSLQAHGEGHLGTQALILALERLSNMQLPKH